jgi:hypothetical protein
MVQCQTGARPLSRRLVAITRQKIGIGVSYTLYLEALTSLANDAMFAAGASTRLKL